MMKERRRRCNFSLVGGDRGIHLYACFRFMTMSNGQNPGIMINIVRVG